MNISKLFQRAHVLRMEDKAFTGREAVPEFYVGAAIGERITDLKKENGETLIPRETQVLIVVRVFRRFEHKPAALRKTLLQHLRWPEDMERVWDRLLKTYRNKPVALHAIADGMEA